MSVMLSISDRITVMEQGKKIAEDMPDRIRSDPAVPTPIWEGKHERAP